MCGIITRIGKERNSQYIVDLLTKLEYRGYDSYGILLTTSENKDLIFKDVDTCENLNLDFNSIIEMGHTRWATHGEVLKKNSHPHHSNKKKVFVVMNGIIENYAQIQEKFNFDIISQSDTEIISHLVEYFLSNKNNSTNNNLSSKEEILFAIRKAINLLKGDFSFVLKIDYEIYAYKNSNPLILGLNKEEYYISSDLSLLENICNYHYILDDGDILRITQNQIECYLDENKKQIEYQKITKSKSKEFIKKNKWIMEDEIDEQINVKNVLSKNNLKVIKSLAKNLKNKKIVLTGAGSSYNAALYLHYVLLKRGILSNVILASELDNYTQSISGSLIITISQSGETADLIHPLKTLKNNSYIISIVNTKNSTLDRLSDNSLYLNCGKEIAVAATKSFLSQIVLFDYLGSVLDDTEFDLEFFLKNFKNIKENNVKLLKKVSKDFKNPKNFFFIGRDYFYPLALEGSLKFKELTYLSAEGFAGGELKHGTLSLIEKGTPVFVLGNSDSTLSNANEVKARGAKLIGISDDSNFYNYCLKGDSNQYTTIILLQLLSFYKSIELGNNPDRPRNLAKSVTVR